MPQTKLLSAHIPPHFGQITSVCLHINFWNVFHNFGRVNSNWGGGWVWVAHLHLLLFGRRNKLFYGLNRGYVRKL